MWEWDVYNSGKRVEQWLAHRDAAGHTLALEAKVQYW